MCMVDRLSGGGGGRALGCGTNGLDSSNKVLEAYMYIQNAILGYHSQHH